MRTMTRTRRFHLVVAAAALTAAVLPAAAAGAAITCRGIPATLVGTARGDILRGTAGPDVIAGLGGSDSIYGLDGNDIICGGNGDDHILGGSGRDYLVGGGGNDTISGGGGNDTIRGGTGDDSVEGGSGADTAYGGGGDDSLVGRSGNDKLFGDTGFDDLNGGGGNDTLDGGEDDDYLSGSNGHDILLGAAGNDELHGGRHRDQFDGGPGDDVIWELVRRDTHLAEGSPEAEGDVLAYSRIKVAPSNGWMLWQPKVGTLVQGHEGVLTITNLPDGLLMVEEIDPERYLLGIAEMPYSWESAALQSQAIAARTYLASLVSNPRYGPMAEYGFDICDWSACQVYKGTKYGWLEPWEDAVAATDGRVLLYNGQPASTFYHSTSGATTRSVEDVWDTQPIPYLKAVPVPDQNSPYGNWWFTLPLDAFLDMLAQDGITFSTPIEHIKTITTEPGEGQYQVRIRTAGGTSTYQISTIYTAINRHALDDYGEYLPALHHILGQAILSPTVTVRLRSDGNVIVRGQGWGHQIGLSQYGANALALGGSTGDEILTHFYTGLVPEDDPGLIPDLIDVGLFYDNGDDAIALEATGRFTLRSSTGIIVVKTGGTVTITRHGDDAVAVSVGD